MGYEAEPNRSEVLTGVLRGLSPYLPDARRYGWEVEGTGSVTV